MTGVKYYVAYPRERAGLDVIGSGDTIDEALAPLRNTLEKGNSIEPGYVVLFNEAAVNFHDVGMLQKILLQDPTLHALYKLGHGRGFDQGYDEGRGAFG